MADLGADEKLIKFTQLEHETKVPSLNDNQKPKMYEQRKVLQLRVWENKFLYYELLESCEESCTCLLHSGGPRAVECSLRAASVGDEHNASLTNGPFLSEN